MIFDVLYGKRAVCLHYLQFVIHCILQFKLLQLVRVENNPNAEGSALCTLLVQKLVRVAVVTTT